MKLKRKRMMRTDLFEGELGGVDLDQELLAIPTATISCSVGQGEAEAAGRSLDKEG